VQGRSVASVRVRLATVLTALAIAGGTVATLPRALSTGGEPPRTFLADVGPSLAILIVWIVLTATSARSAYGLWALPSDLFRAALAVGVASVLVVRGATLALAGLGEATARTLIVTTIEDVLYGLGLVALGALAAFALARTVLRPGLRERPAPNSARDITLRTRFLVATTGASFATAGVLLDVLVDFERTSDAVLVGYLLTAAALVGFAATIGWLVGDDTARGIESVSARLRELASPGSAESAVALLAADEIGELAAAAMEIERRLRREETASAAASERERIARELHDGVAKSVSVLALETATIAAQAPETLRPELARVERLARLLSEELRAIATDMRSRDGGEPFAQSMRRVADRHPHIDVEIDGDLERIGALARFEVLRMVEEGLRNAERHAGATAIVARVALSDGHVELEVEDNGRGIDTDDFDLERLADRGRYGLIGIRERAELLRGTLTIERRPQGGTLVRVAFPLTGP
jgi:signal transduction histidine kinase